MTLVAALTPILMLSAISAYLDATKGMDDRRANLLLVADASLDGVEQSINEATLMLTLYRDDLVRRRCKKVFNILKDRILPLANVARFDTEGVATCSAVSAPGWSLPDPENNARLKRGEKTVRSDTYFSDRSEEWLFAILIRLEDAEGAFAGSAALELRTEQLASLTHADALP